MKKNKIKKTIKKVKTEVKKIKKEWDKAVTQLENFDPLKDMEIPDFSKQMEDFKFDTQTDI